MSASIRSNSQKENKLQLMLFEGESSYILVKGEVLLTLFLFHFSGNFKLQFPYLMNIPM